MKLADSCFHESTINALKFHSNHGHSEFGGTAKLLTIFRQWFNMLNVKTLYDAQRTRDPGREVISIANLDVSIQYLTSFEAWLDKWKSMGTNGLSKQTFATSTQTTRALPGLLEYLLKEKGLEYVLFRNIQSDFIESRFGWYRHLCGGNYFNSVLQFIQ